MTLTWNMNFKTMTPVQIQSMLAYGCIGLLTLVLSWECAGIPERFSAPPLPLIKHKPLMAGYQHPLSDLSDEHLFGEYNDSEEVDANQTQHLRISGIDMSNAKHAYVILDDDNEQNIYHVGDQISSGGKIIKIEKNGITLEHAGKQNKIMLEDDELDLHQSWETHA